MAKRIREEEIFPRNPNKTYGLMELVKGSSPRVDRGPEDMVSSWPHLLIREAILFAGTFLVILWLAVFAVPPLDKPADPTKPPNPAKAPWYFLGLQELVSYDAFWGGLGIPGLDLGDSDQPRDPECGLRDHWSSRQTETRKGVFR